MKYHAFLSYSHSDCGIVAPLLQQRIANIGKPWYWFFKSNLKIFRDETDLSANPDLWIKIEESLKDSENLILLLSPLAMCSFWIEKEVRWWLHNKSSDSIILVIIGGNIAWKNDDFDWSGSTCVPGCLSKSFKSEPLWVDMRDYVNSKTQSKKSYQYNSNVAKIVGAIMKMPPQEIYSNERNRIKRVRAIVGTAIFSLAILIFSLGWYYLTNKTMKKELDNLQLEKETVMKQIADQNIVRKKNEALMGNLQDSLIGSEKKLKDNNNLLSELNKSLSLVQKKMLATQILSQAKFLQNSDVNAAFNLLIDAYVIYPDTSFYNEIREFYKRNIIGLNEEPDFHPDINNCEIYFNRFSRKIGQIVVNDQTTPVEPSYEYDYYDADKKWLNYACDLEHGWYILSNELNNLKERAGIALTVGNFLFPQKIRRVPINVKDYDYAFALFKENLYTLRRRRISNQSIKNTMFRDTIDTYQYSEYEVFKLNLESMISTRVLYLPVIAGQLFSHDIKLFDKPAKHIEKLLRINSIKICGDGNVLVFSDSKNINMYPSDDRIITYLAMDDLVMNSIDIPTDCDTPVEVFFDDRAATAVFVESCDQKHWQAHNAWLKNLPDSNDYLGQDSLYLIYDHSGSEDNDDDEMNKPMLSGTPPSGKFWWDKGFYFATNSDNLAYLLDLNERPSILIEYKKSMPQDIISNFRVDDNGELLCISSNDKIIVAGTNDGNILVWKNCNESLEDIGVISLMYKDGYSDCSDKSLLTFIPVGESIYDIYIDNKSNVMRALTLTGKILEWKIAEYNFPSKDPVILNAQRKIMTKGKAN